MGKESSHFHQAEKADEHLSITGKVKTDGGFIKLSNQIPYFLQSYLTLLPGCCIKFQFGLVCDACKNWAGSGYIKSETAKLCPLRSRGSLNVDIRTYILNRTKRAIHVEIRRLSILICMYVCMYEALMYCTILNCTVLYST